MAIPLIPLIAAVTSMGLGIAQSVSSVKQTNEQLEANTKQGNEQIEARKRQAVKLLNQQKTSFLKSGVYFEGTPEAILDETSNIAAKDIQAILNDTNNNGNLLKRQGKTAFYSALANGLMGAATSFVGLGGMGSSATNASKAVSANELVQSLQNTKIGSNISNWYSGIRGLNKGGFDVLDETKVV
jgi:methylthioribose-1-phosphate isomerase